MKPALAEALSWMGVVLLTLFIYITAIFAYDLSVLVFETEKGDAGLGP